ncbi:sperm motility kinase X-like [Mesocricetus auratus]|uniref:non-specific serine/threonine protein kinase n=1 Tax=Mesocricetus auratus TaxID=10036 RepID=A0ABM2WVH2_MESAU|nr:sperm motility kinase X-like [Mesocricetus auratus]XP_040594708.1 sperm motility kinase X-like [Mesocricetus auratus]
MMMLDFKVTAFDEAPLRNSYKILNTICQGSFGEVKLACHLLTQTQVALKVLPRTSSIVTSEIDIMKSLSHPNVIQLYQIISTTVNTYLVMEYASGGGLLDRIQEDGHLQEEEARRLFQQIGSAVHYCHSKGVVHGNLRPENILVDGEGNIKLSDFGLGVQVSPGQKLHGFFCSLPFCAPELLQGKDYDGPAADMWSLGVLLYFMTTGCLPFQAPTNPGIKQKILCVKYYCPSYLSANVLNVIGQLLTLDPSKRATIDRIMHHPWLTQGEVPSLEFSLEEFPSLPNPIIIIIMADLGYEPNEVLESLKVQTFDETMATYLILQHKSSLEDRQGNQVKPVQPGITPCATPADLPTLPLPLDQRTSKPALHTFPYKCQLPDDEKHLRMEGDKRATMSIAPQCSLLKRTISYFRAACHHDDANALCTHAMSSCGAEPESHVGSQDTPPENNSLPREELWTLTTKGAHTTASGSSSGDLSSEPVSLSNDQTDSVMIACTRRHCPGWKRVMRRVANCAAKLCCCMPVQVKGWLSRNKVVPIKRKNGETPKARR